MPELSSTSYRKGGGTVQPEPNLNLINNAKAERIWLVLRLDRTPFREEQKNKIKKNIEKKYKILQEKEYGIIEILLYQRKLYE